MRTGDIMRDRRELISSLGLEGTIGAAVPLTGDETSGSGKTPPPQLQDNIGGTSKSPLQDHESEIIAELGETSSQGLGLFVKLGLGALLVAACYAWFRAHSPRPSKSNSGRHGAYEKSGSLA